MEAFRAFYCANMLQRLKSMGWTPGEVRRSVSFQTAWSLWQCAKVTIRLEDMVTPGTRCLKPGYDLEGQQLLKYRGGDGFAGVEKDDRRVFWQIFTCTAVRANRAWMSTLQQILQAYIHWLLCLKNKTASAR